MPCQLQKETGQDGATTFGRMTVRIMTFGVSTAPKNIIRITESNELSIKIARNYFQYNEYHHMTACIMTVRIMTVSIMAVNWNNDSQHIVGEHNTGQHKES